MTQPIEKHEIPLKVYKASAGSGKTFTLAVEYIKYLITNPLSYRNILAVTFTNKATEEMKLRILSQLNGLAHDYADSKDYMDKITRELGVDKAMVMKRATMAMHSLLHDYSSFRVETIDKFFQRVLRNLARELNLNANLKIELNDQQVEEMAVDMMIEQLSDSDVVLGWLMSYILENISEDKSWNIIGQVKKFGMNIFKDTYKAHRDDLQKILDKEHFFDQYRADLKDIIKTSMSKMAQYGQRFLELTSDYGSDDFFKGKNGVYKYFQKLADGTFNGAELGKNVQPCLESPEQWASSKTRHRDVIIDLARQELLDLLRRAEKDRCYCFRRAKSATVTLRYLNQLRLLGKIEHMVRELNKENNRFQLSDTQGMLHALIGNSDTPFIFERIGAPLQHIMIDEFQDTGTLQWSNFKILLSNCMDQGYGNLIVGDVKQSIYRWRSGDWRLLNGITRQFNDDPRLVDVIPLDTNYRSCRKVVAFNNQFFTAASYREYQRLLSIVGGEAEQLRTAYADVCQEVPERKPDNGYVYVELLPKDAFDEQILPKIAETIKALIDHGVAQRDIAILARYNDDITKTANYFQANEPEINIVSDEAFRLDSSLAVNILITALHVLVNEKDTLNKGVLAKAYQNAILHRDLSDETLLLHSDLTDAATAFDEWLPEGFRNASDYARLRPLPLTDLVEALYGLFSLDQAAGQSPYVCTFYDILTEHLADNTSDIERFLQLWEEKYKEKTIHGDDINGVRMVSIHKSKGLEFANVIVPFCDWRLEKYNYPVWCEVDEDTFKALPLLPISYSQKSMRDTIYEDEYCHEHLQNTVDNLNLLYVAFTRAKTRLYAYGVAYEKGKGSNTRSPLIADSLQLIAEKPDATSDDSGVQRLEGSRLETLDNGTLIFEYGECFNESLDLKKKEMKSDNLFLQPDESIPFQMRSYPTKAQFRQSNNSIAFTTTDERQLLRTAYIERGNLLHQIFSQMRDINDMERVLRQLTYDGVLYDEISPDELRGLLSRALSHPQVREWFSPKWTLHNECSILHVEDDSSVTTHRPDRVMSDGRRTVVVDFKFGRMNKKHQDQVKTYMKLLADMGHHEVSGYLWYVDANKIVNVKA